MKALKSGVRLKSAVCDTEVMVTKAAADEIQLTCGGAEMLEMSGAKSGGTPDAAHAAGTLVGKRYVDEGDRYEFLCTKGGKGNLAINGVALQVKQAKALPSSD
ncbi:conserved protein of unknown function [Sterolibacterium denitrificans]|uniref:Uncharacterized protein n=1 Tax=Sterolibacterium denitrificans TaxID=157592 RepID=A0A7Z7HNW9_9PROT|nr:hypothetical protein [Sterolibacterium denitrificans]SMB21133.1 conserved protein of unknown function [Sterolibacterium denitrificans]